MPNSRLAGAWPHRCPGLLDITGSMLSLVGAGAGHCHLPPHGLTMSHCSCQPSIPPERIQIGVRALRSWKLAEQVFRESGIFRRGFYEPNSWLSLCLDKP